MGTVMIKCPVTDEAVSTRIVMDPASYARFDVTNGLVRCESCGVKHLWSKSDSFLDDGSAPVTKKARTPKKAAPKAATKRTTAKKR